MDALGDPVDGVEHAVDPHADDRLLAPRLDVDVAGPLLEGVVEQVLDRGDDGLAGGLQRVDPGEVDELLQVADVDGRVAAHAGLGLGSTWARKP